MSCYLSFHFQNVQTGELLLLATAKLRSAVECPFAAHAGGKSRAVNLRHVSPTRRFWGSPIKQF